MHHQLWAAIICNAIINMHWVERWYLVSGKDWNLAVFDNVSVLIHGWQNGIKKERYKCISKLNTSYMYHEKHELIKLAGLIDSSGICNAFCKSFKDSRGGGWGDRFQLFMVFWTLKVQKRCLNKANSFTLPRGAKKVTIKPALKWEKWKVLLSQ